MEMVYRGYTHPSPYRLATQCYGSFWQDAIRQKPHDLWFNEYLRLYTALRIMAGDLITAREEAKKLRYENELMLKLIQEK